MRRTRRTGFTKRSARSGFTVTPASSMAATAGASWTRWSHDAHYGRRCDEGSLAAMSGSRGKANMQAIADVLNSARSSKAERTAAREAFLRNRAAIWQDIQNGTFPASYLSTGKRKYVGAPRRTAIRCDFLLASKIALGAKYRTDRIADRAQRDLLFSILRDREVFPNRRGNKFYCCPTCTAKVYECVSANVFRYIDNAKWKAQIESA